MCLFSRAQGSRAMAVELQWSLYAAVVLLSVHAAHSSRSLQGLSCVNDFVRNVTCTWKNSPYSGSSDCLITGVKIQYVIRDGGRSSHLVIRSCKLEQPVNSFPGCTFSFDTTFNSYEVMPNISMTCNGTLVETHRKYSPKHHIKMHPPGAPNVNSSANGTRISWTPGSPRSRFLEPFYQAQIKHITQTWSEVPTLPVRDHVLLIGKKLTGRHQVRVRVRPDKRNNSHWSDWSPITSWEAGPTLQKEESLIPDRLSLLIWLLLSLGLFTPLFLVFYWFCIRKRLMREKPVPNPSKYFRTLHSIHGGNLKKWLNPVAASESFFVARPCEDISSVEVCDTWYVLPSPSPSSSPTTALLHSTTGPSFDRSRPTDHLSSSSSSSSSCFSNMGYFMSSYDSGSAQTRTPPYFSYRGNVLSPHKKLHLSLCPSFNSASIYESLRREPQSPDSGFEFEKYNEQEENVSDDNQSSPLLLHPPSVTSFSPEPPPRASGPVLSDNQVMEMDPPVAASPAAGGNLSAWPVAGPMCRASSLPVDPCKTGYLTLKELQTTFSNKSI